MRLFLLRVGLIMLLVGFGMGLLILLNSLLFGTDLLFSHLVPQMVKMFIGLLVHRLII